MLMRDFSFYLNVIVEESDGPFMGDTYHSVVVPWNDNPIYISDHEKIVFHRITLDLFFVERETHIVYAFDSKGRKLSMVDPCECNRLGIMLMSYPFSRKCNHHICAVARTAYEKCSKANNYAVTSNGATEPPPTRANKVTVPPSTAVAPGQAMPAV